MHMHTYIGGTHGKGGTDHPTISCNCIFPLQSDDSSTHEKLDFKLHFTCTSYLITTPCYRSGMNRQFWMQLNLLFLLAWMDLIKWLEFVSTVMRMPSCWSPGIWRAALWSLRESTCLSTTCWLESASIIISLVSLTKAVYQFKKYYRLNITDWMKCKSLLYYYSILSLSFGTVVERIDSCASMYSRSIQGHHVCLLVKTVSYWFSVFVVC